VGTASNLGSEWIRIVNTMHTRLLQIPEANEKPEKREEVRMAGSWSDWSEAHSASRWDQYIQGCLGRRSLAGCDCEESVSTAELHESAPSGVLKGGFMSCCLEEREREGRGDRRIRGPSRLRT